MWSPTEDGKQQMMLHLDIEVPDLDTAIEAAVAAGAWIASHQPQETVKVMLDPAGHPFCLYVDTNAWPLSAESADRGPLVMSAPGPSPGNPAVCWLRLVGSTLHRSRGQMVTQPWGVGRAVRCARASTR
jgi:hypothetical protein